MNSVNYLFKWRSPDRKSIPEDFQTRVYSADFPPYFLSKVKEIKRLCGDVAGYVAQIKAPIDAEIGQKDHLWMETNCRRADHRSVRHKITVISLSQYR